MLCYEVSVERDSTFSILFLRMLTSPALAYCALRASSSSVFVFCCAFASYSVLSSIATSPFFDQTTHLLKLGLQRLDFNPKISLLDTLG